MGGGIGMGNTCKPMAVSFQCMTKFTTNKKKRKKNLFLGTAKLFFSVTTPFYCPISKIQEFQFLHILANSNFLLLEIVTAILLGMKWHLTVVCIFITLMTNDVECLFMCLLAICISSLEKSQFKPIF